MSRYKVQYQGTAPGMGEVGRYFDSRERAEQWARQCGVFDRAAIVDCDAAPDLLAALEELIPCCAPAACASRVWNAMEAARAAIAKARGVA